MNVFSEPVSAMPGPIKVTPTNQQFQELYEKYTKKDKISSDSEELLLRTSKKKFLIKAIEKCKIYDLVISFLDKSKCYLKEPDLQSVFYSQTVIL